VGTQQEQQQPMVYTPHATGQANSPWFPVAGTCPCAHTGRLPCMVSSSCRAAHHGQHPQHISPISSPAVPPPTHTHCCGCSRFMCSAVSHMHRATCTWNIHNSRGGGGKQLRGAGETC
jgi:hypothetical protein